MKKLSAQFVVYFLLISLLPLVVLSALSIGYMAYERTRSNAETAESVLSSQCDRFELVASALNESVNGMANHTGWRSFVAAYAAGDIGQAQDTAMLAFNLYAQQLLGAYGGIIEAIVVVTEDPSLPPILRGQPDYSNPEILSLTFGDGRLTDYPAWLVLSRVDGRSYAALCRRVYDTEEERHLADVYAYLSPDFCKNYFDLRIQNCAYALYDAYGTPVAGAENGYPGRLTRRLSAADMRVVYQYALSPLPPLSYLFSVLPVALMMLSLVVCALTLRSLYHPISTLIEANSRLGRGDFDIDLKTRRRDELGELIESYNRLARDLKRYVDQLEDEKNKQLEYETKALQSQIQPHFLYNTLTCIKSLAAMGRAEEIEKMITALVSLLRYNADISGLFVTLEDELRYVEQYIRLMNLRGGKNVRLKTDIPLELFESAVPKFALQPFVENALIHAFENTARPVITVTARRERETLVVEIADNGCGYDPQKAEKKAVRHNRIGMENVDRRIRLYYGESSGLAVDSAPGKGTRVRLTLCGPPRAGA